MEDKTEQTSNPFGGSSLVEHFELPKEYYQDPETMKMLNYIWKSASRLAERNNTTVMQEIVNVEGQLNRGVGSDTVSGVYRHFLIRADIEDKVAELNAL